MARYERSAVGRLVLLAAVVVGVIALLGSHVSPASASHGCSARGKTVFRSGEGRIFVRRTEPRPDADFNYFGCSKRKGSTYRLNVDDEYGNNAERFVLSGRYAGIVQGLAASGGDMEIDRLILTDLVTGRRLYFGPRGSPCCGLGSLFLKRNGSVAFEYPATLAGRDASGQYREYPVIRIYVVTAAGERVAAEGPDIIFRSLRLTSDRRSLT